MTKKKGILLLNLGTPDNATVKDVRKYLTEFLNDPRVIDIPWLARKLLVNLIIIPFRVKNSTSLYKRLWTPKGSPLLIYLNNLKEKLTEKISCDYNIYAAMRYGKPTVKEALSNIKKDNIEELILFPLFPQYASSTTGSVYEKIYTEIIKWQAIPGIKAIDQYYNHPAFIKVFSQLIAQHKPEEFDHVIFSYHGLPNRQLNKIHPNISCTECSCNKALPQHGTLCYKATCYETTRHLVNELKLDVANYSIGFQSRLSKNWLTPFTDETIIELAKKGAKKILITAPSFTADCLETIVELEYEYNELFKQYGGEQLTLVKSLNDTAEWVNAITDIIEHPV